MPDFPIPIPPQQQPPQNTGGRRKQLFWALAVVGFAIVAATFAYLLMNRPGANSASTARSVTYYYRDGKTVLWRGTRLAEADSPAIVHAVADNLIARYSESYMKQNGDWKIVTTLDQSLQKAATQQVDAQREQLAKQKAQDATLIAQDVTTGQIVSWVGSLEDKVFHNSKDRLTTLTQPGSLVLPLVYAAYMDNNASVSADTIIADTQEPLPGYICNNRALPQQGGNCLYNYDRKYLGEMTLRQALGGLRSVPAVKAMTSVIANDTSALRVDSINKTLAGIEAMMGNQHGYSCYLSRPGDPAPPDPALEETQCYTAAAIGDGAYAKPSDIISAFGTLSNKGKYIPQTYYLRLERDGKVIDEWKQPDGMQVVKETTANTINEILSDPSSSYLGQKTYFNLDDKTKVSTITGVVNDSTTVSAIQYTPKYAVGFWAFSDQSPLTGVTELLTLPLTYGWLK